MLWGEFVSPILIKQNLIIIQQPSVVKRAKLNYLIITIMI
jgi:hypothetical protein